MAKVDRINKQRLMFAFTAFILIFLVILLRIAYIQVLNNDFYKSKAIQNNVRDQKIAAKRGDITDRNGMKLAYTITTFDVWARPSEIEAEEFDTVVSEVSESLSIEKEKIADALKSDKSIVKLTSGLNKTNADLIKNKKIQGVWVSADNQREYPYNNFASYIIGNTSSDNQGMSGIEQYFEKELKGIDGRMIASTDVNGRLLPYGEEKVTPPTNGATLVLTIDEIIQHFTEKALEETVSKFKPKRVMAIVMDPHTGDILAMSAKPDFNPNNPRDLSGIYTEEEISKMTDQMKLDIWYKLWRNPLISDTYEPGSTFKLLTTVAGLEEKVVTPNSTFNDPGYTMVSGVKISCWSKIPHGIQTLTEGLENSCNPVFMEIGKKLQRTKFYKHLTNFGVLNKTGVSLPAESSSIFLPEKKVGPVELATMSFGHGISVTPIQMATAISAIANGGNLMKPQIVKAFKDDNGNTVKSIKPEVVNRVMSEETSKQVRLMMESVVENGSGKKAYIPGYRIGGKTGTSEKLIKGGYSKDLAFSSFVGIAPVDDPKIVVLVVVDEPKGTNFGSVVAAPAAKAIMEETLRYLKVEPEFKGEKKIKTPNVIGLELLKAKTVIEASGLKFSYDGDFEKDKNHKVTKQFPLQNTNVPEQTTITVYIRTN